MGILDSKVAIVTGVGPGIERGKAHALAKEGAKIVVPELNPTSAEQTVSEATQLGAEALAYPCDVGSRERDIGRAVVFPASTASDYIPGQTLHVDGGAIPVP